MLTANLTTNSNAKTEKILVCITIQHNSKRLIRKGYELAKEIGGELHILHIAKGESIFTESKNGSLLDILFKYASTLGAEIHVECNPDVTKCIASFIKKHSMTCIVLGNTLKNALQTFLVTSIEKSLESQLSDVKIVVLERDQKISPNTTNIIPT